MKNSASTPTLSRGVAKKNGQELGLENELELLTCIKNEGWIREHEASLITGMSPYTIGTVSRRLASRGEIFRERSKNASQSVSKPHKIVINHADNKMSISRELFQGNAGFFLRLTSLGAERVGGITGKDIKIPACWPHHAMAIQSLNFLAGVEKCGFETEASIRHYQQAGKISDGQLVNSSMSYNFEQERTKKSGKAMQRQAEHIASLAKSGTICYVAYPYPPRICGGINHEFRQTQALRQAWGNCDTCLIKFVRCHFDTLTAYQNMHVSRFEIIGLPVSENNQYPAKYQQDGVDRFIGFSWDMQSLQQDDSRKIHATLWLGREIQFEGVFIEELNFDLDHLFLDADETVIATGNAGLTNFDDFIKRQQTEVVRDMEGELILCAMQTVAKKKLAYMTLD